MNRWQFSFAAKDFFPLPHESVRVIATDVLAFACIISTNLKEELEFQGIEEEDDDGADA